MQEIALGAHANMLAGGEGYVKPLNHRQIRAVDSAGHCQSGFARIASKYNALYPQFLTKLLKTQFLIIAKSCRKSDEKRGFSQCTNTRFSCLVVIGYWLLILFVSAFLFAAEIWANGRIARNLVPQIMGYGYLVFFFHVTMLKGYTVKFWKNGKKNTDSPEKHFWIAYLFPLIAIVVLIVVLTWVLLSIFDTQPGYLDAIKGLVLLLTALFIAVLVSLFGTMIPAAVVKSSIGFSAALKRARSSFLFILWRLIVGPGLVTIGIFFLIVVLEGQGLALTTPGAFADVTLVNTLLNIALGAIGIFTSALTAAILSMAYLRYEEGQKPQLTV
jgi:hypothetical protein